MRVEPGNIREFKGIQGDRTDPKSGWMGTAQFRDGWQLPPGNRLEKQNVRDREHFG
jgi:hypothetical protein